MFTLTLTPCVPQPTHIKRAFTLIELLVVITIISLLAAILFPVFGRARENARRSSCLSNEKQLGLGILQYAQDYDESQPQFQFGTFPAQYQWHDAIFPYVKSAQIFNCPSHAYSGTEGPVIATKVPAVVGLTMLDLSATRLVSYAANRVYFSGAAQPSCVLTSCPTTGARAVANGPFAAAGGGLKLARIQSAAQTVLVVEYRTGIIGGASFLGDDLLGTGTNVDDVYRHFERSNVLFADGHAKNMGRETLIKTHPVANTTGGGTTEVAYLLTVQDD